MKRLASKLATAWLERGARKRYAGNLFDRFDGLGPALDQSEGATILDIGCCDGLVAYEFARHGAYLIHGFELDEADVLFARRLFRDVPVESTFTQTDLAAPDFCARHANTLLERYDVVLFLGVYHHLERQMERSALDSLVGDLARLASHLFVVRTRLVGEVDPVLVDAGFSCVAEAAGLKDVGPVRVYRRG